MAFNLSGAGTGAMSGAATGAAFGPYGAAGGAVLGGVMGSGVLGDLFGNDEETAQFKTLSPEDLVSQVQAAQPGLASQAIDWAQRTGPAMVGIGRQMENVYDPGQVGLREATTRKVAGDLALGGKLPADVLWNLTKGGFEKNALTGLGASGAGMFSDALTLGLTGMDVENQRLGRAMNWSRSAPQFNPGAGSLTPSDLANVIMGNLNEQNAYNMYSTDAANQARAASINNPMQMLGGLGGILGNSNIFSTTGSKSPGMITNVSSNQAPSLSVNNQTPYSMNTGTMPTWS